MSHDHQDRVAERPGYLCAAYGCPMIGTMSAGTKGGEFMCCVHAGKDPAELQAITAEINHNAWLAAACRDVRCRAHNPGWRETYARIKHDLALAGRDDLAHKSGTAEAWMIRLETELMRMVKEGLAQAHQQQPLDMETA